MCIVDTVVLLYFMLTGQERLLVRLLRSPLRVPVVVYDPQERSLPDAALQRPELLSEMRQAISHYEIRAESSDLSRTRFERLRKIDELQRQGLVKPVELTPTETTLSAQLQSRDGVAGHSIQTPLGPGEASCVAIARERGWTIATDDIDALTVLSELHGGNEFPYEQIRSLLVRAGTDGFVTRDEANQIHREMQSAGFWGDEPPFV